MAGSLLVLLVHPVLLPAPHQQRGGFRGLRQVGMWPVVQVAALQIRFGPQFNLLQESKKKKIKVYFHIHFVRAGKRCKTQNMINFKGTVPCGAVCAHGIPGSP